MSEQFIGQGWAFPVSTASGGGIALAHGTEDLEQAIRLILGTAKGERPMRPEFGCAIHDYVFAPADITTAGQIAYEVKRAVEQWEPRVSVADVDVTVDGYQANCFYINVIYVKKGTYDPRNLVFPFYVIPEEE